MNPTRCSVPIADMQAEHTPDFREKMALFEEKCQSEAKTRVLREQDNAQQGLDAEQLAETARHVAALVTEAERHDAALRDFAARQQRIDQAKVEIRAAAVSHAKSLRKREDEGRAHEPPPVVHGRVAQIAADFARDFVDGAETPTPQQQQQQRQAEAEPPKPRKGVVVSVCVGGASTRPMFASLRSAEASDSKPSESPPRARSDDRGSASPTIEMWSLPSAITIPLSLPPATGATPTKAQEAAVSTVATTITSLVDRIAVLEFEHEEENLGDIGSPMRNDAEREHVALTAQLDALLVSSEEESENGQPDLSVSSPTGARRLFAVDDSAGKDRSVGRGGSA